MVVKKWCLALREDHKWQVFENEVLREISGLKNVEQSERMLHNEKLRDLYRSAGNLAGMKSIRLRWAGHVVHIGKVRSTKVWWGNMDI
jgi:hypothetical protein